MMKRHTIAGALGVAILTGILWVAAPFAAAGGGGCLHGTPPTDGSGTTVEMISWCFTPTVLHASPGATVTFVNRDSVDHTVSGVGGTWGSYDALQPGAKATYTFKEDGVYVYACMLHPGMAGAVVIGDGRGSAGLEPASVQPVEVGAAPPIAGAVQPIVTSGNGMGVGTMIAFVGIAAALGFGAWTITRRRRTPVPN